MNLEIDEEYGAGFEGTNALLYKYIKDTPGQTIQHYMKSKNLSEILKKTDPIEVWIRDFIDSDNSRFSGKSKKERIKMALGAYYAAQRNEEVEQATGNLGNACWKGYTAIGLKTKDGKTVPNCVPMEEEIITNYVDFAKQHKKMYPNHSEEQTKAAWEKYKAHFSKKEEVELEESISKEAAVKVSASQINRYIDTENWQAIADLMKFLTPEEHELWAKNGYDGRTYELMMKSRKESIELEEDMIDTLIQQFRDSGRVAVRYPKKKTISVSGINMPEKDAVEKMKKILGVKESTQIDEMRELYAVVDTTDGTVVATASSEEGAKRSISRAHLPPISSEHPSKLKIVKTKKTAQVGYPIKEEINELTEKIDVEALLDAAVVLRKKNPQLRKGQSIMIALHDMDKKAYDNARNKADAFNNDSKIPQLIQLLDPSYYKEEKNLKETPSLETLRIMKIVSLATGCKDTDALYEYALTSPRYSSIVELKEAFNKYIQKA